MTADGYKCFRLLASELRNLGMVAEAESLSDALASGSTGHECLGAAGQCVTLLRKRHRVLCKTTLARLLEECIASVRAAWPNYR